MEPRRRSRRASRRHSFELPSWEEPQLAPENPTLKSTSQGISEFPTNDALASIEDPERRKRQLSRPPSKPRKVHHPRRPRNEDSETEDRSRGATEEKLFIKLQSRLVPGGTEISNIRETPVQGEEDYRHKRTQEVERELANGAKRASPGESPGSKRQRRAARPSFAPVAAMPGDADAGGALDLPKLEFAEHESLSRRQVKQEAGQKGLHKGHKGRGKRNGEPPVEVSEAPKPALRGKVKKGASDDSPAKEIVNNDYCTACGGTGEFLCCETCPRSFHFSCIEAPVMDVNELPDEPWSCRHCAPRSLTDAERSRVRPTLFASLILAFESQNAMAFQMPTHLREMFTHVQSSKYGEYLDESMKSEGSSSGGLRIQDKSGNVLLCFKCHESAVRGRSMAVCSKCREPWHIDCVDPPLESTPLGYWVCPLHVENIADLPLRVRKPILTNVALKRQISNDGDIEITDDESGDERVSATDFNGEYVDEEIVKHVAYPAQTRTLPNGSIVAKGLKHRPRGFEMDRVVYKLPSRAVKLDFLDAVHRLKSEPYRETATSSLLTTLDTLAEKPQPEREAVRNLMALQLQGPAVDAAEAHRNLGLLLDAALNDANASEQIAAIKKLMKEKGRERLLELLKD